jgi:hypothetical protein
MLKQQSDKAGRWLAVFALSAFLLGFAGCADKPVSNDNAAANSNSAASATPAPSPSAVESPSTAANANSSATAAANPNTDASPAGNSNANAKPSPAHAEAVSFREPERYSETATISVQMTGNESGGSLPSLQYDFAKSGADRRAAFVLPAMGEVVYLEHAGQKYAIFPSRKQYVELNQETLGVQLPNLTLMSPGGEVDRLRSRAPFDKVGAETVNGRQATKYHFAGQVDSRTQAGMVQAEGTVDLDDGTGLPLRSEITAKTANGATAKILLDTRNIQVNPPASLFETPAEYKKVPPEELEQQVRNFLGYVQILARMLQK